MTKNPGMAGGPRELLSTKESSLGFTCARRALKYMWLTVLGLKDLRNSNDVANNLSASTLELATRLLSLVHIIASRPQNVSSFRVQGMHL